MKKYTIDKIQVMGKTTKGKNYKPLWLLTFPDRNSKVYINREKAIKAKRKHKNILLKKQKIKK